jgi:allophanate hydrolase
MPPDMTIANLHAAYARGLEVETVIASVYAAIAAADDPGIFISMVERDAAMATASKLGPFDPAGMPLWGVPFASKDNIDFAGIATTAACPQFAYIPEATAIAVQRLIGAGAVLVGKTNLDQFATGLVGVRTPYPVPRNAIDPELVPGGSSSGSAVAVARGLVSFALGTDTAGSGRVPAALNNIVGLKPSLGAISTSGVVPACRTLDCVSVFALTVGDAWHVYKSMAGYDATDPYSRPVTIGRAGLPPGARIGIPTERSLEFFGDGVAAKAFERSVADLDALGLQKVEVDITPFLRAAELLYGGAWVAERYQAIRRFITEHASAMHPVTRGIIASATRQTAADAFAGQYQLAALRRETEPVWSNIDALMVPTIPTIATLRELEADPLGPNSRLGVYTNFVNLLDLAALAVPGRFRSDGRPAGITLIGPRGQDALLAALGSRLHATTGGRLGATKARVSEIVGEAHGAPRDWIELVVVGAHMSRLPLNHELKALGGVFVRTCTTAPVYRLFALPGGPPERPGLLRVGDAEGASIAAEVWALPADGFGRFVAAIPPPLGIGTVQLADGARPKGFLVEPEGVRGAADVSRYLGWRAYLEAAKVASAR